MSEFAVRLVQVKKIGKHPDAHSLSITSVDGCPIIFKTDYVQENDKCIYIPVDAVVDSKQDWVKKNLAFVHFNNFGLGRIKAKKLRGIFSMGLLIPLMHIIDYLDCFEDELQLGDDLAKRLNIIKYEEQDSLGMNTGNAKDPGVCPVYDVEHYRKYRYILDEVNQNIVITEKLHGCNSRFGYVTKKDNVDESEFYVGSHNGFKLYNPSNMWWHVANQEQLSTKLANAKLYNHILYGEVYGQVQDLKYDTKPGEFKFAAFDMYDISAGRFWDFPQTVQFCADNDIWTVPILYTGPVDHEMINQLANENRSTIASNIREGIVVRPVRETWHGKTGRVILKHLSEHYLLRKHGTEHH